MRVRASQVLFAVSAVAFILGGLFAGLALLLLALGVMVLEGFVSVGRREKKEEEEKIIRPLE